MKYAFLIVMVLILMVTFVNAAEPMESVDSGSSNSVGRKVNEGPLVVLTASEIEEAGGIYPSVFTPGDWFQLKLSINEGSEIDKAFVLDSHGNMTIVRDRRTLSIRSDFNENRITVERKGSFLFIYPESLGEKSNGKISRTMFNEFVGR